MCEECGFADGFDTNIDDESELRKRHKTEIFWLNDGILKHTEMNHTLEWMK
jgi:hypothetical protein